MPSKKFKKTKLDAISIAAPTILHCPTVLDVLEARGDVLVEMDRHLMGSI